MPNHQILDLIVNAYNSALAFAVLILMLIEHLFNIWPAIGLNYSPHTAVADMRRA